MFYQLLPTIVGNMSEFVLTVYKTSPPQLTTLQRC